MKKIAHTFALLAIVFILPAAGLFAQKTDGGAAEKTSNTTVAPKVVQIDEVKIRELLKPNGKPLLVNFWATWCVPCREEFPELVEIDNEYRGRIDFITITLDVPAEINRDVPKFLNEMKATMPTYLLKTPDENEVIGSISKDWAGGLPFTVLYDKDGNIAHTRQGKIKPEVVKEKLDGLLVEKETVSSLPLDAGNEEHNYKKGIADARKDIADGKFKFLKYGMGPGTAENRNYLKEKYGIEVKEYGCLVTANLIAYIKGYNEIAGTGIKEKFGLEL
jgi:thiol-disulfide isomerase/thioredoxin